MQSPIKFRFMAVENQVQIQYQFKLNALANRIQSNAILVEFINSMQLQIEFKYNAG